MEKLSVLTSEAILTFLERGDVHIYRKEDYFFPGEAVCVPRRSDEPEGHLKTVITKA